MAIVLRKACVNDLDNLMRLENSTFTRDAWSTHSMLKEIQNENCAYWVALSPDATGSIVGYAGLCAPHESPTGDIQTIAVESSQRGRGIGRLLMHNLIAEAQRRRVRDILLEVRADNPIAQSLYYTLGFEAIDTRVGYYQPDGVDAIVMRLTNRSEPKPEPKPEAGVDPKVDSKVDPEVEIQPKPHRRIEGESKLEGESKPERGVGRGVDSENALLTSKVGGR